MSIKPRRITPLAILRRAGIVSLVLLPLISYLTYEFVQSAPLRKRLRIATSIPTGRHHSIASRLIEEMKRREIKQLEPVVSGGSLDNLRGLQVGAFDFALYQAGTEMALRDLDFASLADKSGSGDKQYVELDEFLAHPPTVPDGDAEDAFRLLDVDQNDKLSEEEYTDTSSIRCVATLYPEVVHFLVQQNSGIEHPSELRGKVVSLGGINSGNYAMSREILDHFMLEVDEITRFDGDELPPGAKGEASLYHRIMSGFQAGELDAAILTIGYHSPVVEELLGSENVKLKPIPHTEGLTTKNVLISPYTIPAGTYRGQVEDVETIGVMAQLLTRSDVADQVVAVVASIILDRNFQKRNTLRDLFTRSDTEALKFIQDAPEFSFHPAAKALYNPEDFDAGIFEGWEALYSLIASAVLCFFFGSKYFLERRERNREHKLDRYIQSLFEIESKQVDLDQTEGSSDIDQLQKLLDEVTFLRRQALREFTAHELNDDRAVQCFLEMCHFVSIKVSDKITRQRLDKRFNELLEAFRKR